VRVLEDMIKPIIDATIDWRMRPTLLWWCEKAMNQLEISIFRDEAGRYGPD
jgi:hypothetical protein